MLFVLRDDDKIVGKKYCKPIQYFYRKYMHVKGEPKYDEKAKTRVQVALIGYPMLRRYFADVHGIQHFQRKSRQFGYHR